jgi:hypothetical protein
MKATMLLALAVFSMLLTQETAVQNEEARLKAINDEIAKTTSKGKEIIELVKLMMPEVNGRSSTLSLERLVEVAEKEKGVTVIGWAASIKRNGRWRIVLYYRDNSPNYQAAEWEYNPDQFSLYPFDLNNAPQLWSESAPPLLKLLNALSRPVEEPAKSLARFA